MSSIHLSPVMALNAPYRLAEAVPPAVLVIRMAESVLVEDYAGALIRITGAVQIPIVSGVSALDRHVHVISHYDVEIGRIHLL